jgi:hypothetical protein
MSQYLSEELEWLNSEAMIMTESLTRLAMARLGYKTMAKETFNVYDAYAYARKILGTSLAQCRRLFYDDKKLDAATAELYARSIARKEMYSARTRRVVSGKLTRIIKKQRMKDEEQRAKNGVGPFQGGAWP